LGLDFSKRVVRRQVCGHAVKPSVQTFRSPASAETLRLPDGRKLGVSHFGELNGKPLFFFHGFGVSRLAAHPDQTIAQSLGVHLIAMDRPGIGLSDPQPNRTLLDWPNDVAALADALRLPRFAVLGWSAGGPHALACACKIPDRLTAVSIVSSAPPFSDAAARRNMPANVRQLATDARIAPWAVRFSFWQHCRQIHRDPKPVMAKSVAEMVAADRAIATDPRFERTLFDSMVTACSQTARGLADDVLAIARPWGFRLGDITLPVQLWHGEADTTVPPQVGYYLATAIPSCHATFYPGEGHFMYLTHWREILSVLTQ
jgi:pimeloyl-ACP methyl ester carboxylesterase